ncbi:hypothetical protein GU243_08350 [Pseudarthrobacter psychrotolerans]|uniref:Uncharacterized protein n=1 Tax=Pseudarthrobacter psychrotolerans TaxID=2697569 RepID=A0A6P1NLQ0_9MICC|nr:hypothetical protein [Pseudarthrobacter psychrotolerans]QHK19737.1 hypothetical protein GU243_08350 [Pseudarthrobacter psychrotolerans]
MVILFIWFFLLSLLFLLARQTRVNGFIAVNIQAGPHTYTEQVPVSSAQQRHDTLNRVLYVQGLIGHARQGQTR